MDDAVIQKVVGDDEWNLKHVATVRWSALAALINGFFQLYQSEEKWRSVTVETVFQQDVTEISSQIGSILQARDASIYKAFSHSSLGTLSPAASAEMALMDSAEGAILSPADTPGISNGGKGVGKIRKMSKIFMDTVRGRKSSTGE